jgi:cytochrome c biogenesis protein CcmG/thiol:disulfide interchange protein DsbE
MQQRGDSTLHFVEQLIQAGKHQEALRSLAVYLKSNPGSVQAWWMLSQVVPDKKQQSECLERVLKLDPGHAPAKARLEKFKTGASPKPIPPSVAPFTFSPEEELAFKTPERESLRASRPESPSKGLNTSKRLPEAPNPPVTAPKPVKKPAAGKRKMSLLEISVLAILMCILTASVGTLGTLALRQKMANDLQATQVMAQAWASHPPQTLPPTWTATVTSTLLPSQTPAPSETASPTVVLLMPATNTMAPSGLISQPLRPSGPSAPNFTLKDVASGKEVSLSDYKGRPVVLVFWATWCGYCEREMSALKSTYKSYQDAGLVILAINAGDSASDVRSYRKSHGLTFPVLLDPKRKTLGLYKVSAFPTNVFIDTSGRTVYTVVGMMDSAGLSSRVQALLGK